MPQRQFETPSEIQEFFRVLAGVHRPSRSERVWVAVQSVLVGGASLIVGAFALSTPESNPTRSYALVLGAIFVPIGIFLFWNLWRFLNAEYRFTPSDVTYAYPPNTIRWSLPAASVRSIHRVPASDGGERLRFRGTTSRWLYCTRSMRSALDSVGGPPAG